MNLRHYVRFARYILKHKWFVFVAGLYTRAPLWRLLIHDWSKFTPIEFFSYAEFSTGTALTHGFSGTLSEEN